MDGRGMRRLFAEGDTFLNASVWKDIQDRCSASENLYLFCIGKDGTKIEGTLSESEKEVFRELEQDSLFSIEQANRHCFWQLNMGIEDVVKTPLEHENFASYGIAIRKDGVLCAVWNIVAFFDSYGQRVRTTNKERLIDSLYLLEACSNRLWGLEQQREAALEQNKELHTKNLELERELQRKQVLEQISQLLDVEEEFIRGIQKIFACVSDYMNVSQGVLFQRMGKKGAQCICLYQEMEGFYRENTLLDMEELPFFTGKPYFLSSDASLPEVFGKMFRWFSIKAAVFLPIEVNREADMYLCFYDMQQERSWSMEEIRFFHDVKQKVQNGLEKRIEKNSLISSYAALENVLASLSCGVLVYDEVSSKILYSNENCKQWFSEMQDLMLLLDNGTLASDFYLPESRREFEVSSKEIVWVGGRKVRLYTFYERTDETKNIRGERY